MAAPAGFEWTVRRNGEVVITHHGRRASVLRGRAAERLLERLGRAADEAQQQHVLARATGNYRRGNERR